MAERRKPPNKKTYWKRRDGKYTRNVEALTVVNKEPDSNESQELLPIIEEFKQLQEKVLTRKIQNPFRECSEVLIRSQELFKATMRGLSNTIMSGLGNSVKSMGNEFTKKKNHK